MKLTTRLPNRCLFVLLVVCVLGMQVGCRTYAYRRAEDIPLASDPNLGMQNSKSRSARVTEFAREASSTTVNGVATVCKVVGGCALLLVLWSIGNDDDERDGFESNRGLWKQGYGYNNPNAETAR